MKRLLPRTLAGQMIALLLLALLGAQTLSFWFFFDERRAAVRAAARGHVFSRTGSIVRLLAETPPRLHGDILDAVSNRRLRFWVSSDAAAEENASGSRHGAILLDHLRQELPATVGTVIVELHEDDEGFTRPWRRREALEHRRRELRTERSGLDQPHRGDARPRDMRHRLGLTLSVQLPGQNWLNAETALRIPPLSWALPTFAGMAMTGLALVVIVIVMIRRITRPMQRLAVAADRLGRGEAVAPLPPEGPEDVRRTTEAFDRMRERLQRFVQDRTQMLAAISHDMRTPLTTLRLRAEFISDTETQEKMLATIDEMNAMVEATLTFAREEAAQENTRSIDLAALIESICADLADLGHDAVFAPSDRAPYACRLVGLKRAIRNLVENAVRYGTRAAVRLERDARTYTIIVEDDGPGIPEGKLNEVFEPFVRLDESRSKEGGGIGLGLSIVRSIVQSHGGEVGLTNRSAGGLRAKISLPLDQTA